MRTRVFVAAVLALLVAGVSVQEARQAAAGVVGKWNVALEGPQGPMTIAVSFKQEEGKAISGTFAGPEGETPLKGEFADGKLSFLIEFIGGNGAVQITFTGQLNGDKLAGTLTTPRGEIPWTAERAKE